MSFGYQEMGLIFDTKKYLFQYKKYRFLDIKKYRINSKTAPHTDEPIKRFIVIALSLDAITHTKSKYTSILKNYGHSQIFVMCIS